MEKVTRYRKIMLEIMQELSSRRPVNMPPTIERHLIVDKEQNHFILINAGKLPNDFRYEVVAHVQIKNGKFFILEEIIDPGIFLRLEEKGIPEKDILPVYLPDFELEEEFALA